MSAGAPWSVKGIDPKAREIAKDLARRSGMTLGEWLNQMIMDDGQEPPAPPPQARRRFDPFEDRPVPDRFSPIERPAPPVQRLQAEPVEEDDIARIAQALDRLSSRIEAAEDRSTLAISGIDQSVVGVLSRIESAERQQNQVAARFEGALEDVRTDQQSIAERLSELETARNSPRSAEALKSLEGALTRVANHLYDGEDRTREALSGLRRDIDSLADRPAQADRSNDPGGAAALVEQVVERIAERLQQAEARTTDALKGLEGSFAHLDSRLASAEGALAAGDPAERRFEALAADLTQRVEQVRSELAERLQSTSDGRLDRVDGALREMTQHVQAAERRSAQAIERMGQEVVRITDGITQKIGAVETRNAEAIQQVGGEMARIADAVEGRMKRADGAQAEALEKLGSEIARITERLAERIANAERRSAQSMDDVGEQVSRATDRLQQRQERASSELIDRMRQSEERTARLLDEAREKIDQRLSEAQRRLAEIPAPAAAVNPAYADPFAPGTPFSPPEFGPFGGQGFASQPFGGSSSGPPPLAGQAPLGASTLAAAPFADPMADDDSDPFNLADPFAASTAPPPFAAADIEAAEALGRPEPEFRAAGVADLDDGGRDQDEFDAGAFGITPPEDVMPSRSATTREVIAQARAAARAASQATEAKGGAKGGGMFRAEPSSPLFSGFGLGRKKAVGSSTLKTALLMSAAAAFLGIGAAGVVLQNGGGLTPWRAPSAKAPQVAVTGEGAAPQANVGPLESQAALALAPSAMPAAPPPEAQTLYDDAVGQIEAGDNGGLEPLRKSANLGYAPAQYYLAKLYEDGKAGLKKDVPDARRWTERAAANGEPRAMHNLATFYYYGEGGPQNTAAAVDWFKKAANLGWVDSQFNLAVMYEKGLGVRQNPSEAYKWYVIAGRGGDEPSRGKATDLKKLLSPVELATAENAAAGFRAESPNASARAEAPSAPMANASLMLAQRALARLGYYQGPSDGAPSPALRLAISAYQRDQGLAVSGALTPELMQQFATATR